MRIWKPTVHWHESDLGTITHGNKNEREFNQVSCGAEVWRGIHQRGPIECGLGIDTALDYRQIKRNRAEESECYSHGANNEIFPSRFHSAFCVVKANQQRRGQRCGLHENQKHARVRRELARLYGEDKKKSQAKKPPGRREAPG